MKAIGLKDRATFTKNALDPSLADSLIEMTHPNSPSSPKQKYRLTAKGHELILEGHLMEDQPTTLQADRQVTPQVETLLKECSEAVSRGQLMEVMGLKDRANFSKTHLEPALAQGWVEMTLPQTPNSPNQKYRVTDKGRALLNEA
jgi:DNA-binding PadR family transcriptional regulator